MDYLKRSLLGALCLLVIFSHTAEANQSASKEYLQWQSMPDLPDALGVGGAFAGVHDDVLIVAGGANFPEPAWENQKTWRDQIWVLRKTNSDNDATNYEWLDGGVLDIPLAYGGSVSTDKGVICMGGCDAQTVYDKVFTLTWDPTTAKVKQQYLPSLPKPLAFTSATMIGNTIYLAGGQRGLTLDTATTDFWCLDLSKYGTDAFQWQQLEPWPGPSRAYHITVAQHNGFAHCVYVMSGRRIDLGAPAEATEFLTDIYEYNPSYNSNSAAGSNNAWRKRATMPACVMAGVGIAVGQSHIFALGGDPGDYFATAGELKLDHPGFSHKAWGYHTITDTWVPIGDMPASQVTATPVPWDGGIIIPSGEIKPRIRTPKVWKITPITTKQPFGAINFAALVVYLLGMVGVGYYFSFRNKNTDDFFRGGKKINKTLAGLSMFATMLSSICFIAVPAKAYATDLVFLMLSFPLIIVTPFTIKFVLPFFRRIDAVSAYEYLEKRFNVTVRLFCSLLFAVFQVGRMAIVLYLPALALAAVTPLTEIQCVLVMGVISTLYCTMGGIIAVVWTDAIQSVILLGTAIASFILIIAGIEGGWGEFVSLATAEQKMHMINWDWGPQSFTTTAFWVVMLGGIGQLIVPYSSDQAIVQRYMVTPTQKKAAHAIWINGILSLLAAILFFILGTALFVFYKKHPQLLDPTFKTDAIFPQFISRQLPVGLAGMVIAGIFAAAQSTISTSINSVSSTITTDFIRRFHLIKSERGYLTVARTLTFLLGSLGTVFALVLVVSDIRSAYEVFLVTVMGLFGGIMCGLFMLGIFTKHTTGLGAMLGAALGATVLFILQKYTPMCGVLNAIMGVLLCFGIGAIVSLVLPKDNKSTEGLTAFSMKTEDAPSS